MKKPMSTIDPSRLLQMRSSILNQNQALQRAAGQGGIGAAEGGIEGGGGAPDFGAAINNRSEEHTSELQSLMRISYAVFCLKKKNKWTNGISNRTTQNAT